MTIAAAVKKCIAEQFSMEESEVTPEHTFDALGADSLDMVELLIDLETKLDTSLPDEFLDTPAETTVSAYIEAVEKHIAAHPKTTEHFQH